MKVGDLVYPSASCRKAKVNQCRIVRFIDAEICVISRVHGNRAVRSLEDQVQVRHLVPVNSINSV
jgi:hypothetical protein